GITRPVGASVDAQGNIYVADECGGAVWRIAPDGTKTRIGGFGMPDDVVLDQHGNLLITDLQPSIHALIRLNLATGKREVLARQGYIEPQGLLVDAHDNIFVSDDTPIRLWSINQHEQIDDDERGCRALRAGWLFGCY